MWFERSHSMIYVSLHETNFRFRMLYWSKISYMLDEQKNASTRTCSGKRDSWQVLHSETKEAWKMMTFITLLRSFDFIDIVFITVNFHAMLSEYHDTWLFEYPPDTHTVINSQNMQCANKVSVVELFLVFVRTCLYMCSLLHDRKFGATDQPFLILRDGLWYSMCTVPLQANAMLNSIVLQSVMLSLEANSTRSIFQRPQSLVTKYACSHLFRRPLIVWTCDLHGLWANVFGVQNAMSRIMWFIHWTLGRSNPCSSWKSHGNDERNQG